MGRVHGLFRAYRRGTGYSAYCDSCECPHWGYLFNGKLRFVYNEGREEIVSAGEMYYVPAGHTFQVLEDAETVEFSPSAAYKQHMDKVTKNMAIAQRGER